MSNQLRYFIFIDLLMYVISIFSFWVIALTNCNCISVFLYLYFCCLLERKKMKLKKKNRFLWLERLFFSNILLINKWSLQPQDLPLQRFCSAGRMLLVSRKLYVLSVIMDINNLYIVDRHVKSLQFLGLLVSFNLGSRYIMPCVNHLGFISGFLMDLLRQLVIFLWLEQKAFNQKLGTLFIPGDFHFCDFPRAFFRSSTIISCQTRSSNPSHLFSFLLSHSAFLS